jgi:ABC-type antimicrobial peptide transport system permease subunit
MTPVVIGLAAGAAAAPVLGQGIRALLFDVRPGDPATIAGVVLAMIAVAVLACVVPARRVTGPNAVAALRSE